MTSTFGSSRRAALATALVLALLAAVAAALWIDPFDLRGTREIARALVERGRVAVVGDRAWLDLRVQGATLAAAETIPGLTAALQARAPDALRAALRQSGVQGLLVSALGTGQGAHVGARLARYEPVAGLRGLYLSRGAALYTLDPLEAVPSAEREALAVVARAVIGGARPPKLSSFPESLRRVQPVEVMVLLREREQARLWRSARGSSLARALLTAAEVARDRWREREQAMGGALSALLPKLAVEVALLIDDGTIASKDPAFIDRVFFDVHGVGYERKGAWRYSLPEATAEAGKGRASRAYRKLFSDDGLEEDSFERHELRLYRLRVHQLARSEPEPEVDDGLGPPRTPDEIARDAGASRAIRTAP